MYIKICIFIADPNCAVYIHIKYVYVIIYELRITVTMPISHSPRVNRDLNAASAQLDIAAGRTAEAMEANQAAVALDDHAQGVGLTGLALMAVSVCPELTAIVLPLTAYLQSGSVDINVALISGVTALLGLIPAGVGILLVNRTRRPSGISSEYFNMRDKSEQSAMLWDGEAEKTMKPWNL